MKKIVLTLLTLIVLTILIFAHGFIYDWLEICEYNGKSELVFGRENIINYEYDQRLEQVSNFNKKESEHFIFHYPKDKVISEEDIALMEEAYTLVNDFWDNDYVKTRGTKIDFIWVPGKDRYDKSEIEKLLGVEVQGMARSRLGIIYSIFSYTPHELNHVVSYTIGTPPIFLNEGFANYFNKFRWEENVLLPMKQILEKELLIPIENLMESKEFRKYNEAITYRQMAMFVKFLVEQKGKDKFIELYSSANRNFTKRETIELIEKVYDEDYKTIEKQWLTYLEKELK